MLRILLLVALIIFSGTNAAQAARDCVYNADSSSPVLLNRGVNLTRWWENDQTQMLTADGIKDLHGLGFDFVRLPLSTKWLTMDDKDEQAEKLTRLRCDLISLLNRGLAVVVDLHAPQRFQKNLEKNPDMAVTRLGSLWESLQPVLDGLPPDRVFLGLYNEPQIENKIWWGIQGKVLKKLRAVFPQNTFVVSAGPHGEPWNLAQMKPYDDKNVIYEFHYYEPVFFTHHGANWFPADDPIRKTAPVAYPVDAGSSTEEVDPDVKNYIAAGWNRARLAVDIGQIADWKKRNGVKIACLEFGVYRPFTDADSRNRWLRDMRELLEQNGIPWALWEYRGGFGLLDDNWTPDEGIVKVLGLNDSPDP